MPTEEMRELYMDAEKQLAIEKTSRDEIIEKKVGTSKVSVQTSKEIEKLKQTLQGISKQYSEASAHNLEMKNQRAR